MRAKSQERDNYHLDRSVMDALSIEEITSDTEYWMTKTPAERLQVLEYLRWRFYGDAVFAPLERVLEITTLDKS